ncbi:MAG: S26 family signal peptidase [Actinobacteria bacterium 13_1_20CM_3_71_11]|nr:MAG: S26 family signal peptidase [Actinobacteria bacterium 13_1_20CM_3_71_11]TML31434.1 MAG: S26 family signal peptidase [Actinomycetota bacterium]
MDRLFPVLVRGPSMVPALRDGDALLVRRTGRVRPGDVVVVRFTGVPGLSVKRAVRPVEGGWWVEGDNPYGSTDSRELGPAQVVGRVVLRWWPGISRVGPRR